MTEHQDRNGEIRSEEDTTNIRRIGAKDRKKQIRMSGALFPDEPAEETGEASAPPIPSEQAQPKADAGVAARPDTASKRTASKRPVNKAKRRSSNALLYNLIALVFVLATIAALVYFVFLWNNFNSPLNPFAPPTPMPNFIIVTPSS